MLNQKIDYDKNYKKRIIIFMLVTGLYLLFSAVYTITSFFMTIPFNDNPFLYTYCTYAIWFNAYTYYRYYKNSVEEERKYEPETEFLKEIGWQPFNHKKARREIFLMTSLAIFVNGALMIATRWLWV